MFDRKLTTNRDSRLGPAVLEAISLECQKSVFYCHRAVPTVWPDVEIESSPNVSKNGSKSSLSSFSLRVMFLKIDQESQYFCMEIYCLECSVFKRQNFEILPRMSNFYEMVKCQECFQMSAAHLRLGIILFYNK